MHRMGQPHSTDLERAVLACSIQGRSDEMLQKCMADDFFNSRHRDIFNAVQSVVESGGYPDLTTVKASLETAGRLDLKTLVMLDQDMPNPSAVNQYIEQLHDYSLRRRIQAAGNWSAGNAANPEHSGREIWSESLRRMECVTDTRSVGEPRHASEIVNEFAESILNRQEGEDTGIPTGFAKLDKVVLGLAPGRLHLIAGRPGMGKSVLGQNLSQHAAIRGGGNVLLFSLEMSEKECLERLCASEAGVSFTDIRRGGLGPQERLEVESALHRIEGSGLYIDDSSNMGVNDVVIRARRAHQRKPLDLVCVDYLSLLSRPGGFESDNLAVGSIARELKVFSKDNRVPVIGISQLNRACERREDKRPMLADLRDSGELEQHADIIMFVYRDSYYDIMAAERDAEIIVAKHRGGPTGTVKIEFDGSRMRFNEGGNQYKGEQKFIF